MEAWDDADTIVLIDTNKQLSIWQCLTGQQAWAIMYVSELKYRWLQ